MRCHAVQCNNVASHTHYHICMAMPSVSYVGAATNLLPCMHVYTVGRGTLRRPSILFYCICMFNGFVASQQSTLHACTQLLTKLNSDARHERTTYRGCKPFNGAAVADPSFSFPAFLWARASCRLAVVRFTRLWTAACRGLATQHVPSSSSRYYVHYLLPKMSVPFGWGAFGKVHGL
jgi:hypothetical protein